MPESAQNHGLRPRYGPFRGVSGVLGADLGLPDPEVPPLDGDWGSIHPFGVLLSPDSTPLGPMKANNVHALTWEPLTFPTGGVPSR